ncbi:hypothetical protein BKA57DRAFT_262774 [Linnemannia elongata]|nr:hypothetical protein BKA57DRAFT_262774 [Linnemannia elongata]
MHPLPLSLSRSLPSVPSSLTFYSIVSFVDHSSIFMYLRSCRREYKMADPSPLLFFFFFCLGLYTILLSSPLTLSQ